MNQTNPANPELRSNFWKLNAFCALRSALFMIPIMIPLFQSHGLSMKDIFLLQGLFGVAILLLEVPSGYLSDVLGRRQTLILGSIGVSAGLGLYPFMRSFEGFLVAELILGFGASFISGSVDAITWDSLAELGEEEEFSKYLGRQRFSSSLSEAISSVIGGGLAVISLQLPLYAEAVVVAGIIPLAWSLTEPKRERFQPDGGAFHGMKQIVRESLLLSPDLRRLIVLYAVLSVSTLAMAWYTQAWFQAAKIPLAAFGILWAVIRMSVGFSALLAPRLQQRFSNPRIIGGLLVLLAIGYAGTAAFQIIWMVWLILLFGVVRGVSVVVFVDAINRRIDSDRRATVLSLQSFLVRLIFAPLSPLLGWMVDVWSLSTALWCSGTGMCLVLLVLFLRWRMLEARAVQQEA